MSQVDISTCRDTVLSVITNYPSFTSAEYSSCDSTPVFGEVCVSLADELRSGCEAIVVSECDQGCAPLRSPTGDSDRDSVMSDYSEMADAVKEHLANIQLVNTENARGNFLAPPIRSRSWATIQRRPDEDELDFLRRRRKTNFLSLAQEFADLKRVHSDALPFDLHQWKTNSETDLSEEPLTDKPVARAAESSSQSYILESSPSDTINRCGTENCHGIDTSEMPVALNTNSSQLMSCGLSGSSSALSLGNIPDIVQGLGYSGGGSTQSDELNDVTVTGSTIAKADVDMESQQQCRPDEASAPRDGCHRQKSMEEEKIERIRHWERENIRLKLVMSDPDDDPDGPARPWTDASSWSVRPVSSCTSAASLQLCYVNDTADDDDLDLFDPVELYPDQRPDLISDTGEDYFARLELEAKAAFAQAQPMAHKQLLFQKMQKPDTTVPYPGSVFPATSQVGRYDQLMLSRLSLGQLQVLVNGMLARVEALNLELVTSLMERDDLHNAQDAVLVEIEDVTEFLSRAATSPHSIDTN